MPETVVRSLLHRAGFRFRKNRIIKTGKKSIRTDITFPKERIAVFIDGCFWHGCQKHCRIPQSNREYWQQKIGSTVARDLENARLLGLDGWIVIRQWEHVPSDELALSIAEAVVEKRSK